MLLLDPQKNCCHVGRLQLIVLKLGGPTQHHFTLNLLLCGRRYCRRKQTCWGHGASRQMKDHSQVRPSCKKLYEPFVLHCIYFLAPHRCRARHVGHNKIGKAGSRNIGCLQLKLVCNTYTHMHTIFSFKKKLLGYTYIVNLHYRYFSCPFH